MSEVKSTLATAKGIINQCIPHCTSTCFSGYGGSDLRGMFQGVTRFEKVPKGYVV